MMYYKKKQKEHKHINKDKLKNKINTFKEC